MTSDIVVDSGLKIRCEREALASRLGLVSRGISARPNVQIFGSVLMQAVGGELELAATDMEISLRASLPVEIEGEGSAAVPGKLLGDIVRMLPGNAVEIEYLPDESSLLVKAGSALYRLRTYAVEDFPRFPDITASPRFRVAAGPFLESIASVSRAAGRDESRPVLTGVNVRLAGDRLTMVATDSYRLSACETELPGTAGELEAIIPARALEELKRIAGGAEEIELGTLDNHVVFGVDGVWLTSRRIDGQFPDHTKLIPDVGEFAVQLTLARAEALDVVRRVGVMAHRAAPLRLRLEEGELTVSAQTQDVGEAQETLPVSYSGEPLEIGFNADYLRDGLESVEGEDVVLRLINPLRPGLVQGKDDSFRYLIMPIRLPD